MKSFTRYMVFSALFVPALIIGCEGQDGAATKTETPKTSSPSTTESTPANSETDPAGDSSSASLALTGENTKIEFVGAHKEAGKDDRFGYFKTVEGTANVADGKLASLDLTIDTQSIVVKPAESKLNEEFAGKLKDHLSNADFFNTSQFPTAKFVLKNVSEADGKTVLVGDLTMLETTKEISIPATVTTDGGLKIDASTEINRTDFGMDFGLDDVVEMVKLEIHVDAKS